MTNNTEITNCSCAAKTELETLRAENSWLRSTLNRLREVILEPALLADCHLTLCRIKEEYACLRDEEGNNIIEHAEDPNGYYFTEAVRRHRLADRAVEDFTLLDNMLRGILDGGFEGEAWR